MIDVTMNQGGYEQRYQKTIYDINVYYSQTTLKNTLEKYLTGIQYFRVVSHYVNGGLDECNDFVLFNIVTDEEGLFL
jgi:hypothetical protein